MTGEGQIHQWKLLITKIVWHISQLLITFPDRQIMLGSCDLTYINNAKESKKKAKDEKDF